MTPSVQFSPYTQPIVDEAQRRGISVDQLVAQHKAQALPYRQIDASSCVQSYIRARGYELDSVLKDGQVVQLTNVVSAQSGARVIDCTDSLADSVKQMAMSVAKGFRAPVLGIDFISLDIAREPGKIIELNPHPDITLHISLDDGQCRNPVVLIVGMLFPELVV